MNCSICLMNGVGVSVMRFSYRQLRSLIREAMLNAYQVLGVGRNATPEEIKAAWRDLAIKNHPDRGGDLEKMKDINAARDILNTPKLRSKLDYELGSSQRASSPFTGAARGYASAPKDNPFDREREYARKERERAEQDRDRERARAQARQDAEYREYAQQRATRNANRSSAWRRFEYINAYANSKKFWEVNVDGRTLNVRWGRIGSKGQDNTKVYDTGTEAFGEAQKLIRQKLDKGYREVTRVQYKDQQSSASSSKQAPPTPKQPTPKTQGKKTTYKVYGRVSDPKSKAGGSDVHTRVKGKVYAPRDFTSRARQNQQVNVNVRDDGRLGVSDPSGEWSQVWDRNESVEFNELVLCELVKLIEARERDRDTSGKYKHSGNWDRLCVCGHPLREHTAEKVGNERPCIHTDFYPDEDCVCMLFRPAKRGDVKLPRGIKHGSEGERRYKETIAKGGHAAEATKRAFAASNNADVEDTAKLHRVAADAHREAAEYHAGTAQGDTHIAWASDHDKWAELAKRGRD